MLINNNAANRFIKFALPALLYLPISSFAGQPMKCVDGTGRVIYTELSSCVEAFRAAPPPAPKPKSKAIIESEQRQKEAEEKAKFYRDRAAQIRSDARKRVQDLEYQKRQRLIAEDEQQQKECAAMLIESDQRYHEAEAHGNDSWWRSRSENYDSEMEKKCGHEPRLRR